MRDYTYLTSTNSESLIEDRGQAYQGKGRTEQAAKQCRVATLITIEQDVTAQKY